MTRPTSLGDLQKGDRWVVVSFSLSPLFTVFIRYNNMDAFLLASFMHVIPTLLVILFVNGLGISPLAAKHPLGSSHRHLLATLIPKFHLPTHKASCHLEYNFIYIPCVGRTDGEALEHGWAATNAVANSTKEIGPGSRRDTLPPGRPLWGLQMVGDGANR